MKKSVTNINMKRVGSFLRKGSDRDLIEKGMTA